MNRIGRFLGKFGSTKAKSAAIAASPARNVKRVKTSSGGAAARHLEKSVRKAARKPLKARVKAKRNVAGRVLAKKRKAVMKRKAAMARKAALAARKRQRPIVRPVRHRRVQARPVFVRREIMMPAPWSKVEKYKKVKKENMFYNQY
jgi:hypothetical protein